MWVARALKRLVDKNNALSLRQVEFKKLDSGVNRSFFTLALPLRLVATNIPDMSVFRFFDYSIICLLTEHIKRILIGE